MTDEQRIEAHREIEIGGTCYSWHGSSRNPYVLAHRVAGKSKIGRIGLTRATGKYGATRVVYTDDLYYPTLEAARAAMRRSFELNIERYRNLLAGLEEALVKVDAITAPGYD
jgi:hypothetical protein